LDRRKFLRGAAGTALGVGLFGARAGTAGAATTREASTIESVILAAYADGQSRVVVPPGTYKCPISVRLAGISGMEIVVDGVKITRARPAGTIPKTLEFWSLAACSDLRIVGDMTISSWKPFAGGYYPLWEGHHAFGIHACERVTIEGARIRSVWGDFFYLRSQGRNLNYRPNRDIQLIDIDADDCGRHSIGMHAIDGLDVVGGTLSNWHRSALNPRGIDYETLVPEDYHANIRVTPETQWIHETTALRA
jgi:polygalacturonase